jgi:serine/threonine-protein kinase
VTALLDALRESLAGRYTVERELGRGGMATVFLAQDVKLSRTVAVKTLDPDIATKIARERFLREIAIASSLQHPNILTVHDSGTAAGMLYYVMPYVEGESLRQRLDRETQLPLEEALAIAREVADALSYAHSRGIVHRDIKPGNILLSGGHALVADFGIARAITAAGGDPLTQSSVVVGTPAYMPPEQADPTARLDARADVYALGCVLYEMLVGEPPFTGPTAQVIFARALKDAPPSLRVARPTVPEPVERAVTVALAKAPADRFSTAARFIEALSAPPRPDPLSPPPWWRHPKTLVTAAAALVAVGIWQAADGHGVALDANKVVVFPLLDRAASQDGAGENIASLIGSALEHTEPLKWIDGWTWLDADQRADLATLTALAARDITRRRGARYYIDGSIVRAETHATVILRLSDAAGDSLVTQESVSGAATLLNRLGLLAVNRVLPRLLEPGRQVDLAYLTERRPAAVANWLQGEREYRRSRFRAALVFYQRAVKEDSALAMAALKGAQAASWENLDSEATTLVGLSLAHAPLLTPRHRTFALGLQAYLQGKADTAVTWLSRALVDDPAWAEAHMALGEVFYHLLPDVPLPLDSVAEAEFARAAQNDSGFAPPVFHLAEIAIRRENRADAHRLFDRFRDFDPDSTRWRPLSLMHTCVTDGVGAVRWRDEVRASPMDVLQAARSLSVGGLQNRCAERGFRALLADPGQPTFRWGAFLGLHGVLASEGRHGELGPLIDSAVARGLGRAPAMYFIDVLVGAPVAAEAAQTAGMWRQRYGEDYGGVSVQTRWLLAAWHARRGDSATLVRLRATLLAETARPTSPQLARALDGHLALSRGDTVTAYRAFGDLHADGPRALLEWGIVEPLAIERLALAKHALARGEFAEAERLAALFDHPTPVIYLPFVPLSLTIRLRAAEALHRSGMIARFRTRLRRLGVQVVAAS